MKRNILIPIIYLLFASTLLAQSWKESADNYYHFINASEYDKALNSARESLEIASSGFGEESDQFVLSLGFVGRAYYLLGDYNNAIEFFIQEKDLKKKVLGSDNPSYALSLNNLSVVYQSLGRYREAEPLLLEALEIKRRTVGENDTSYAKTLNNLGQLTQAMGRFKESEDYFVRSLDIKRSILGNEHPSCATGFLNLGILNKSLGNYKEAVNKLSEAVSILERAREAGGPSAMSARYELAMVYMAMGDEKKTKELLDIIRKEQINEIHESHPDYPRIMFNLGILQWSVRNYDEAEKSFTKVLKVAEKMLGQNHPLISSCFNALGVVYWQKNDLDNAFKLLSLAVETRKETLGENHPDYATSIHNLAGLLKDMGDFSQAEEYYHQAFALYLKQINDYFPFLSDNEKARFYANLKERFDIFNCYVLTRYRDNPKLVSKIFNYRLATKAILLNSLRNMRKKIALIDNEEIEEKFNLWMNIRENLAGYYSGVSHLDLPNENIDSLEMEANRLEKEVSYAIGAHNNVFPENQTIWTDIKDALQADEASVEIMRFNFYGRGWTDTVIYAAMIIKAETQDQPEFVVLKNGKELEELYINAYKKSIVYKLNDKESFTRFWKDISDKIGNKKTVYISLDGVYNKINLNTIQEPDGTYLVDKYDFVILSNSAEILNKPVKLKHSGQTAYLFGHPVFLKDMQQPASDISEVGGVINYWELPEPVRDISVPDLPGTKDEIEQIATILKNKKWNTSIFMDEDASEQVLKSVKSPYLLHIATHGYFLSDINLVDKSKIFGIDFEKAIENPLLRSGLLLSGAANTIKSIVKKDEADNGIFTSYEAMNLDLNGTKLLVLSACETGLGEIRNGEGVYGLQRSLLAAGAENILMSLWNVNDQVTRELMISFYQKWISGSKIRDAFRSAQLEIKDKYPEPYFWGAFVLIGKGE